MNQLLLKRKNEIAKKRKKGFTLVELIIVIAIIAILAAMAIPKMGAVRDSANKKADLATAKNISTMIAAAVSDGSLSTTDAGTTAAPVALPSVISGKLDGTTTAKVTGSNKGKAFKYSMVNENIVIYYDDGTQVYPETSNS